MKKNSMLASTVWAIQPDYLSGMIASLEVIVGGGSAADHRVAALKHAAEVQAARRQQISASTGGSVAVLPLYGVISQRSNWMSYYFGGTSTEAFTQQFRQALADPNITAIVIDVDSPGGSVSGVDELASEIYAARGKKTIVAISNTLNASAAYYISSAASKLYVMPSSLTGSIGVYSTHEDDSGYLDKLGIAITLISAGKFKVEGNSFEPLTDDARASMQKMVDGYYKLFTKAVAKARGVKADDVMTGFGEGRVLMASDAISAGLADGIGTLDSVLAKFGVQRPVDGASFATNTAAPSASTWPSAADTKLAKGDRVESLADHMTGMKGMVGKIAIVKDGPYYAIEFDEPMDGMKQPHKWLAQNELKVADDATKDDMDMSAPGDAPGAATSTPEPEAAKKDTKADELDDNTDDTGDDDGDEDDKLCDCKCKACLAGDHADCTADEKCGVGKAKAAAEHESLVALERQRVLFALNV